MPTQAQAERTCSNASSHSRGHSASSIATPERSIGTGHSSIAKEQRESAVLTGGQTLSRVRFWLLMFNVGAVGIMGALDTSIVATAIPNITDDFHTVVDIGWYSVAFRLCQCAFQFQYGKAYKLFSVKRIFLFSNVLSTTGSALCATAISSHMLVLGRAIAGFGYAGLNTGAMIILARSTPLPTRPTYLGLWSALTGLAIVAGPSIGGIITQTIGWRYCFYMNLPIGGLTLLLTAFCLPELTPSAAVVRLSRKEKWAQLDLVSSLALVPALSSLFLALSWAGNRYPWHSSVTISLLVAFSLLGAAFIYHQFRRGETAALPVRIMANTTVFGSFVFATSLGGAAIVLENYLPIYFQVVRSFDPVQSGYLMLAILLTATLGAVGSGLATTSCGYYAPFMFVTSGTVPIAAGLITTFGLNTCLAKIILVTALFGLGYGVGSVGPVTAVQTVLADEDIPIGISAVQFGSSLGPSMAVSIAHQVFTSRLSHKLGTLVSHSSSSMLRHEGLMELGRTLSHEQAREVARDVNGSLTAVWYLVVASGCVIFLSCLPLKWCSVKKASFEHDQEIEGRSCFAKIYDWCVSMHQRFQAKPLQGRHERQKSA